MVIGKVVEDICPLPTYLRYSSQRLEGLKETDEYSIDDRWAVRANFD